VSEQATTGEHPRFWLVALSVATVAFLVTRFLVLDRDLPPWSLSQYSPIDEFTYVLPAFNLHHYGTWTYQIAPWAQAEGWPMNVAQTVLSAITLELGGYTYVGFRASSVAFGLVAFLTILDVARRRASAAVESGAARPLAIAVVLSIGVLLLLDFSFLIAGRIIEPTIVRLAGISFLLWLVERGTLLGRTHSVRRSVALGDPGVPPGEHLARHVVGHERG